LLECIGEGEVDYGHVGVVDDGAHVIETSGTLAACARSSTPPAMISHS